MDKEIALVGTNGRVFGDVLGALMAKGVGVAAMVDFPEKVMVGDTSFVVVSHADWSNHQAMVDAFSGYHDVVLTYNDDLSDPYTNDLTLKYFVDTLHAVREAGVSRVIVVGSPVSQAFFVGRLKGVDDIDWVFISTEGDYPERTVSEVVAPRFHKEIFTEG